VCAFALTLALGGVAGGQDTRLERGIAVDQTADRIGQFGSGKGEFFAYAQRRGLMVHSDNGQLHWYWDEGK